MKTHALVHGQRVRRDDRVRSFPRISVREMRSWLRTLADAGYLEEVDDDWQLTPAGRRWFAGISEIDIEAAA